MDIMQFRGIPLVGVGSQPEEDETLDYMSMPKEMATYQPVLLPEQEALADHPFVLQLLAQLQTLLQAGLGSLDLSQVNAADKRLLGQILSEGEVSILFDADTQGHLEIQETSLPGVWWHRRLDANKVCCDESLEVGEIPSLIQQQTFAKATSSFELPLATDEQVINAPGLLSELQAALTQANHTLNLSLLPLSEADLALVSACLGMGKTAILSRGYGNCRITATAIQRVWWVQYYNSTETLILNTLEVADVPLVACASADDIADSAQRLNEIREALQ